MRLKVVTFLFIFSSLPAWGITLGENIRNADYLVSGPHHSVVGIQIKYVEPKTFRILRSNYCSGAILGQKQVLTSAHCFLKQVDAMMQVRVVFGANVDRGWFFSETLNTSQLNIHPRYNFRQSPEAADNFANDFAVISLKQALPQEAVPVLLPQNLTLDVAPHMNVELIGYGASHFEKGAETADDIGQLRHASGVISQVGDTTFHIDQREVAGICKGDSGSPALLSVDGRWMVVGIARSVTPGTRNDLCKGTGNFLRLEHFLEWQRANG